ncbi:MAG: hypothetical protein R3194_10205 [Limnobacter sp.]|nr:hypothetical protein [Limnobacter sp.]
MQVEHVLPKPLVRGEAPSQGLPSESLSWLQTGRAGLSKKLLQSNLLGETLARIETHGGWVWPSKKVCFISDLHADANAFFSSLEGMGYVHRSDRHVTGFAMS